MLFKRPRGWFRVWNGKRWRFSDSLPGNARGDARRALGIDVSVSFYPFFKASISRWSAARRQPRLAPVNGASPRSSVRPMFRVEIRDLATRRRVRNFRQTSLVRSVNPRAKDAGVATPSLNRVGPAVADDRSAVLGRVQALRSAPTLRAPPVAWTRPPLAACKALIDGRENRS